MVLASPIAAAVIPNIHLYNNLTAHTHNCATQISGALLHAVHLPHTSLQQLDCPHTSLQQLDCPHTQLCVRAQISGALLHAVHLPHSQSVSGATQLKFLPDSTTVAVMCSDGGVRFVDVKRATLVAEVRTQCFFINFL
jgi:hypothetical protein